MEQEQQQQKYQTSVNNKKCIGPCYPKGTWIIHPVTLQHISSNKFNFCPTVPWTDDKNHIQVVDECYLPNTDKIDNIYQQQELDLIVPTIHFSYEFFLKVYYNLDSFEDVTEWVANNKNNTTIQTRLRIMECGFKAYGKQISIINEQVVDFYLIVFKEYNPSREQLYEILQHFIDEHRDNIEKFTHDQLEKYYKLNKNFKYKK